MRRSRYGQVSAFSGLWNGIMAIGEARAELGAMSDRVNDTSDVEQLLHEIGTLRGKVAQLQERVEQLDMLAHEDSLVALPNRRGFVRALERLIDRVKRYKEEAALLYV